jgi:ferredoxin
MPLYSEIWKYKINHSCMYHLYLVTESIQYNDPSKMNTTQCTKCLVCCTKCLEKAILYKTITLNYSTEWLNKFHTENILLFLH